MTPGMEALAEAMRLEQARIYGQLQHEHHATDVCTPEVEQPPVPASNVTRLAPPRERRTA